MTDTPRDNTVEKTPYELLGGELVVRRIVERFYDAMNDLEPKLAALHEVDENGKVSRGAIDRFAMFYVGWLGRATAYLLAKKGYGR